MNSASLESAPFSTRRAAATAVPRILSILSILVLPILAACSSAPDTQLNRLHPVTAPVELPTVTVLDPGSGDTSVLAYSIPPKADRDSAQLVTVKLSQGFRQTTPPSSPQPPQEPPREVPSDEVITLPLSARADAAPDPEGPAETEAFRRSVIELTAPATHSDSIRNAKLAEVTEFGARERQLSTGASNSIAIGATQQASDDAKVLLEKSVRQILNAQVVFPSQPLGVGASWEVERPGAVNADLIQRTTYTVTSITGTQIEMDVTITESPRQTILQVSDQEQLTVVSSQTASKGKLTVDTTQVLPISGDLSWTTRLVYAAPQGARAVVQDSMTKIRFDSEAS